MWQLIIFILHQARYLGSSHRNSSMYVGTKDFLKILVGTNLHLRLPSTNLPENPQGAPKMLNCEAIYGVNLLISKESRVLCLGPWPGSNSNKCHIYGELHFAFAILPHLVSQLIMDHIKIRSCLLLKHGRATQVLF